VLIHIVLFRFDDSTVAHIVFHNMMRWKRNELDVFKRKVIYNLQYRPDNYVKLFQVGCIVSRSCLR